MESDFISNICPPRSPRLTCPAITGECRTSSFKVQHISPSILFGYAWTFRHSCEQVCRPHGPNGSQEPADGALWRHLSGAAEGRRRVCHQHQVKPGPRSSSSLTDINPPRPPFVHGCASSARCENRVNLFWRFFFLPLKVQHGHQAHQDHVCWRPVPHQWEESLQRPNSMYNIVNFGHSLDPPPACLHTSETPAVSLLL